jgi:hypothetical protein
VDKIDRTGFKRWGILQRIKSKGQAGHGDGGKDSLDNNYSWLKKKSISVLKLAHRLLYSRDKQ